MLSPDDPSASGRPAWPEHPAFPAPPPSAPIVPPPPWSASPSSAPFEAARTRRSRGPVVIGGVVAAAVVLAAAAAGVTAARRDARPAEVSFETPTGWREFPAVQFATQKGTPVSTRAVGIDPDNIAVLQTYRLPARVDTTSLGPIQREVDALVHQLAAETGASILSGPVPTTLGPLPGFRYQITTINGLGHHVESRLVFGFLDTTEYFLNCQHTAEQAHQVEAGCDIIVRSFWVR